MGDNPLCVVFLGLYQLSNVFNALIAQFLSLRWGLKKGRISWNFHLCQHLNGKKAKAFASLTHLLKLEHFSNGSNIRLWKMESSLMFSTKSFFTLPTFFLFPCSTLFGSPRFLRRSRLLCEWLFLERSIQITCFKLEGLTRHSPPTLIFVSFTIIVTKPWNTCYCIA